MTPCDACCFFNFSAGGRWLHLLHCCCFFSSPLLSCQPLSSNVCPLRSLTPLAPVCFWAAHPADPLFLMFTVIVLGLSAAATLAPYIFLQWSKKQGNGKTATHTKKNEWQPNVGRRPNCCRPPLITMAAAPTVQPESPRRLPLTSSPSPSPSPSYLSLLLTNLGPWLVLRVIVRAHVVGRVSRLSRGDGIETIFFFYTGV